MIKNSFSRKLYKIKTFSEIALELFNSSFNIYNSYPRFWQEYKKPTKHDQSTLTTILKNSDSYQNVPPPEKCTFKLQKVNRLE